MEGNFLVKKATPPEAWRYAVLKAFAADYVDSLCGTPYPVDYDIWLRRLERHIREEDIDTSS